MGTNEGLARCRDQELEWLVASFAGREMRVDQHSKQCGQGSANRRIRRDSLGQARSDGTRHSFGCRLYA